MPVVLETERLFLRELLLNDVEPLAAVYASPETTRFLGGPRDQTWARKWILEQQRSYRENGFGVWAVVHRDSGTLVGQCGIRLRVLATGPERELFGVLDPACWSRRFGTEVFAAVRDFAFRELGLDRVVALVGRDDRVSRKLAANLGMTADESGIEVDGEDRLLYAVAREQT